MAEPASKQDYLSTTQAAALCAVHRRTVLRWIQSGALRSSATPGGWNRISRRDLSTFMREHGMERRERRPRRPRVAVVDDYEPMVSALLRLARHAAPEAEIRTASDGFSAGLLAASFRPDLLFLDLWMPGLHGVDVCRQLRAEPGLAATAIVVVSAHLTPEIERKLSALGADRCLPKALGPKPILDTLREYLPADATADPGPP